MSFGSGPALDENFDLSVNETGDLKSVDGVEELHKDLSFQLQYSLETYIGAGQNTNVETNALTTAIRVLNADSRVDRVIESTSGASLTEDGRTLTITMNYITNDGEEQRFVYEV